MTKHTYQVGNLIGVVLLGDYQHGDIRRALQKSEFPFVFQTGTVGLKEIYCSAVSHRQVPLSLTVSYEGSSSRPQHILASSLSLADAVEEADLNKYLDAVLRSTGIEELESVRQQFEAEPFKGWQLMSRLF